MPEPAWRVGDTWDPGNGENRERTRLLTRELRARLLAWDPIGNAGNFDAQDEYDCLISPLMHRLSNQEAEVDVGDWLLAEVRDHFGMTPDEQRERALIAELKVWWAQATAEPT